MAKPVFHPQMNLAASAYASGLFLFGIFVSWNFFSAAIRGGIVASVTFFLITLIVTGFGRFTLRFFKTFELSESEKTLIGCTLGLGLLSQGMFLLGAVGAMRPWAVVLLLSVMWVFGFTELRETIVSLGSNRNLMLKDRPLLTAVLGLLLFASFWATWVPPHQYDALVYHLPLPSAYLRTGNLSPVPWLIYSHFPQNSEMLFAVGLIMGSENLPQMFSWWAMVLCVWWVFEMGKREMPATAALIACVLIAGHTSVMLLASSAYVEMFVMLWITAAVLSFCRWGESAGAGSKRGWLLLSGIFAGLGLGSKYTAGICMAVLMGMLAVRAVRENSGRSRFSWDRWSDLAFFSVVALLAGSPWLVKNFVLLGNPVFPFLYKYLPHHGVAWADENAQRYFKFLVEYEHRPGRFLIDLVRVPYLAVIGSPDLGGGMDVLGVLGWALTIGLAPAAFFGISKNSSLRKVGIYCVIHAGVWFSTRVVLRFLSAIIPLICLVEAAGLYRVWEQLRDRSRALLVGGVTILLACNLGLFLYTQTVFNGWKILLGLEDRDQFLSRILDYYPCARWAQDHLDKDQKILIVGEQRSFYVAQGATATTPMAPNQFVQWANQAASAGELARLLRAEGGFGHLLVAPREASRLSGYGIFAFTSQGYNNWKGLEDGYVEPVYTYTEPVHNAPACSLLRIR